MTFTVGHSHPSIWHFMEVIKGELLQVRKDVLEWESGKEPPPKKNKKYVNVAKQVKTIVESYLTKDIEDYLQGLAYTFTY